MAFSRNIGFNACGGDCPISSGYRLREVIMDGVIMRRDKMGTIELVPFDINPKRTVELANKTVKLFKDYGPELRKGYSNVLKKATEMREFIQSSQAATTAFYIAQVSTLLLSFAVTYDNYKRGDECVRSLSQSRDINRRLKNLYDCKIQPMLKKIDEELSSSTTQTDPKVIRDSLDSLNERLQETSDIQSEILKVVNNVHAELESQKKKNTLSVSGFLFGLGSAAFLATPVGAGLGLATAVVSAYGYSFGADNEEKLKEAMENLKRGRKEANDHKRELRKYITKLEKALLQGKGENGF